MTTGRRINRRRFLQEAGSTLAASAAAATMISRPAAATGSAAGLQAGSSRKVVVIGAGFAGLAAAYDLDQGGFDVTLIEAKGHPGGRVRTIRDPFAGGLYGEMGAEYVDASDEVLHRYCKEFGLKVMTAKLYDGIFVRGKRISMAALKNKEVDLPYEGTERGKLFGQEAKYTKRLVEMIKDPMNLPPEILKLDNLSVVELLLQEGAPQDIITLYTYLNATESTARPHQMSSLGMVRSHAFAGFFNEDVDEGRIFGGNDLVAKAMAKALGQKVLYRRPVRRIAHDANGTEVWFEEGGSLQSIRAAHLVVTIPFSVLRDVELTPKFSSQKMKVINEINYGQVMKVAMQFTKRFWDEPGSIGQRVFTDTMLRRVYDTAIDQPGPRGLLMSFTSGADAEKLGLLSKEDRLRKALVEATKIWPEAPKYWEGAFAKYWNEDPYARGSYTYTGVGQTGLAAEARIIEGPVHFAGEHTIYSTMDGAIRSGLRTSEEIKKAVG